ncbi:MAG: efflux RND transporter permease subunit, partial [Bacteroidales bacterium]|nr:efflux RND transporter permease subunit [Bacteroidales bacterium]
YNVTLDHIIKGVKNSNLDVGARTVEINKAEYFIRGIGYVKNLEDLEEGVLKVENNTPIRVKDVARVSYGPAERRGILDKMGAEAVGGVVVARYGSNPMEVINRVKEKIMEITPGLPSKTLDDGTISYLWIVPFYDRSGLIKETLGTLEDALSLEILITIIVIIIMVINLRASVLISFLIPVAILMTFIAMKYFNVDANIVALSGIAIAIGTIVDVGIVLSENMIQHIKANTGGKNTRQVIYEATVEVAPAVLTAIATTIISFIPVFTLEAAEGKLFRPLAFTKTFVLFASIIVAIMILPAIAHWLFSFKITRRSVLRIVNSILILAGIVTMILSNVWVGLVIILLGGINFYGTFNNDLNRRLPLINVLLIGLGVLYILTYEWMPLGVSKSYFSNYFFVFIIIALLLSFFLIFIRYYKQILGWALKHKVLFITVPSILVIWGFVIWMGFGNIFGFVAKGFDSIGMNLRKTAVWNTLYHEFPGIGKEFMPALDEGSFLLMPTSMPHTGVEKNKEMLQQLDMAVASIPEVEMVVGKAGRVTSSLDPAPLSMFENVINYKNEYKLDENGRRIRFKVDDEGSFVKDEKGKLIPDKDGKYYRQWRDHIKTPDDIWDEIVSVSRIPGVTSAPKLQPIETRLVMLQTGMRAPMGIKVMGNNLDSLESFGLQLEEVLKEVPGVKEPSVFAERVVGKPYLEIHINRKEIARYGLTIRQVQHYLEVGVGGMKLGMTVEGRERYPIRVRYPRELRNSPETLEKILIPAAGGISVPLSEIADIKYVKGPQVIKSENTFLVSYVIFDKEDDYSEVQVVEDAQNLIEDKLDAGEINLPAGLSYQFTGNYENQIRAEKRLSLIIPVVFVIIFLLLYFQFRDVRSTLLVFSGIIVAFSGGFILIWLYGQDWFMNFSLFGQNFRDLFQMKTVYLSVAVWVGFIALFGIATDDGVIMTTYLKQVFGKNKPRSVDEVRKSVIEAGSRRVRPCLMTTATTILALLPILTSTGKGSDVMVPMAIPIVGGMLIEIITLFVIPVIYSAWKENVVRKGGVA